MDKSKGVVLRVMKLFNEEYPDRFKLSEQRRNVWEHLLEGFDPEVVLSAAMQLVSEARPHPPNIGIFRTMVVNMTHGEIDPPSASDAWGRVLQLLQGRDVCLTPLERAALKKVGTTHDLKVSNNTAADRAQFKKAFDDLVKRRHTERSMLPSVHKVLEARAPELPAPPSRALPGPELGESEPVDPEYIASLVEKAMHPIEEICKDHDGKGDN